MSTQTPAPIQPFDSTSIEKIAYGSVETIPTIEPNDRNRLGYHIWRMLSLKEGTLSEAILSSGARLLISQNDAAQIIRTTLQKSNIKV